ncbi:pyridoxamine 5'-phosphate oxidase family protein [Pseudovibrio exalbescens]|nr:pyridoxamine 5'-phosphate oxidase family protein [Pseudovibrio exalbescens]
MTFIGPSTDPVTRTILVLYVADSLLKTEDQMRNTQIDAPSESENASSKTLHEKVPAYARIRQSLRAEYDWETINAILDTALVAHVGFIDEGRPMVIPMAFARIGRRIYIHGAKATRIVKKGRNANPVSITVTHVDGIVCARSAFHTSFNYRSAVLHGTAQAVTEKAEKLTALEAITNHILPDRWSELRQATSKEITATGVWALDIEHAAAKVRQGLPNDDEEDYGVPVWGGVVPVVTGLGLPIDDGRLAPETPASQAVVKARKKFA